MASRSIYYESSESDDVDQQSTTSGESIRLPVVKTKRTRGRPRGNPQPLNAEERRLRNAQYERERRNELADAMRMLAEAAGFDDKVSNVNLLASVLSRLRNAETHPPEEISELRRKNALIERQILEAESRLASEDMTTEDEGIMAPTCDTAQRVVGTEGSFARASRHPVSLRHNDNHSIHQRT